jgi:hypothetical protein
MKEKKDILEDELKDNILNEELRISDDHEDESGYNADESEDKDYASFTM